MRVCGVIAEYDPFHKGHQRHLRLAREKTGADYILCVMSGYYTQRGMPALLPPDVRAEMALACGADAVVQLPVAFSVREGDVFSGAGVEILQRMGCVDCIAFGCETADLPFLQQAAHCLEERDAAFEASLKGHLEAGLSYAAAQGKALEQRLGERAGDLIRPNAALALGYLRALKRMGSATEPVVIHREQDYHAGEVEALPSATAVRRAILRGDWQSVAAAVPEAALPVLMEAVRQGRICRPESMDGLLRHALHGLGEEGIRRLPGVDEGLECRIFQAAREETTREAILQAVKTRRYTRGRISRALCWAVLGKTKEQLPLHPACVQVLGFREGARPLMKAMQQGDMPLVMRPARENALGDEMAFAEIWQVMAGRAMGEPYRRGPVIFRDGKEMDDA